MKIALVHDYLKEYGGAERVLEALHKIWPKAPVYTLFYLPRYLGLHRPRFQDWDIRPLIPGWFPGLAWLVSPLRLLAPLLFARPDLRDYQVILVSATGAYTLSLLKARSKICCSHTPPHYLYGLPTAREWKKHWWWRLPAKVVKYFLRLVDFYLVQTVDCFVANSKSTAKRIWNFYRRQVKVVYPPVELPAHLAPVKKSYFLAGGRLARPKRIDLVVRACNRLRLPLKVFGRMFAGHGEKLRRVAGLTVKFLGEVTEEEKVRLLAGCQVFIFPAEEEDFGIVPVEALSFGKPVIALDQGGVKESIVEVKTGKFFEKPTGASLVRALRRFKPEDYCPQECLSQAEGFGPKRFRKVFGLVRRRS